MCFFSLLSNEPKRSAQPERGPEWLSEKNVQVIFAKATKILRAEKRVAYEPWARVKGVEVGVSGGKRNVV